MTARVWGGVSLLIALSLGSGSASGANIDDLKAKAKRPPKEADAALALGKDLRRAGLYDDALRVLRGAYGRAPKGDVGIALRFEAARTLISANKQKEAVRECATLKALSATKQQICTAEAHLLWKRAELAMPLIDQALASDSSDYDAIVAKGRALRTKGSSSEAEAQFRSAIGANSSRYEAHAWLGELMKSIGRDKDAADALKKAVAAAPEEPEPLWMLGSVLPAGSEATDVLKKAIAIRPKYGNAHARLGEVLLELGAFAESEQAFRTAIGVDAKQADWHAGLAHTLVGKGAHDEALKEAAAATKLVGNHAGAKLAEADALAGKGEIDMAIEAYEKAASYSRSSPDPLIHAAQATLKGGRPTTARAFADRATGSFPDWAPAWLVLGDVAASAKEKATAKSAYQKALSAPQGKIDKAAVKKKVAALK